MVCPLLCALARTIGGKSVQKGYLDCIIESIKLLFIQINPLRFCQGFIFFYSKLLISGVKKHITIKHSIDFIAFYV